MNAERKEGGSMRALFLGALVVGSVVIFALGVMVGSNVNLPPEAFKAQAPGTLTARDTSGTSPAGTAMREEITLPPKGVEVKGEDMSFYKTLAEPNRTETAPVGTAVEPVPAPAPVAPLTTMPVAVAPAPAASPELPAKPSAKELATPVTAAPAPAAPKGKTYSVQVMLTNDAAEGQAAADSLTKNGFEAYLVTRKGAKYHTAVRVGRLPSEAEARKLLNEINKKTKYRGAFLVKE